MSDPTLDPADREALLSAVTLLENPGFAIKVADLIGAPVERGMELLPQGVKDAIATATRKSLEAALKFAVNTMQHDFDKEASLWLHKFMVAATGAGGGFFGLPALTVELPVSTTIIMRSIADIARSEGEKLNTPETQLACIEVFALGGRETSDDAADSAYFLVRGALGREVTLAADYIARHGITELNAPAIVRFLLSVADRLGLVVTEKMLAQGIPLIGAAGGAIINTIFMDHYQCMARGHFTVRRLERKYSPEIIRAEYQKLTATQLR